jgi:hypothetical protein
MAEMDIKHTPAKESDRNKSQVQSGERGAEGRSGGLAKRGFSSPFFALTPRDIFTASPFDTRQPGWIKVELQPVMARAKAS